MSEPTKGEMLGRIKELSGWIPYTSEGAEIDDAIRRLIEKGPKVSGGFVERKANEYSLPLHWLYQLLREAGVEVEE